MATRRATNWRPSAAARRKRNSRSCGLPVCVRGWAVQDRPTAGELLEALGDFMRDRAENARDRWERFQFQVAANSIGIVKRELELEDGFMRAEWQGLNRLLGVERLPEAQATLAARLNERNIELSERIRHGEFD